MFSSDVFASREAPPRPHPDIIHISSVPVRKFEVETVADGITTEVEEWTCPDMFDQRGEKSHYFHRTDGPACSVWATILGKRFLIKEEWLVNNEHHRVDGPSFRHWVVRRGESHLIQEEFRVRDKLHRLDGPANLLWRLESADNVVDPMMDEVELVDVVTEEEEKPWVRVPVHGVWYHRGKIHRDGMKPVEETLYDSVFFAKRGEFVMLMELMKAGHIMRQFMRIPEAKRKLKRRTTMAALRKARCTVFPGLENLIFQFV
jgi:hypothetical protein